MVSSPTVLNKPTSVTKNVCTFSPSPTVKVSPPSSVVSIPETVTPFSSTVTVKSPFVAVIKSPSTGVTDVVLSSAVESITTEPLASLEPSSSAAIVNSPPSTAL